MENQGCLSGSSGRELVLLFFEQLGYFSFERAQIAKAFRLFLFVWSFLHEVTRFVEDFLSPIGLAGLSVGNGRDQIITRLYPVDLALRRAALGLLCNLPDVPRPWPRCS